MERVRDASVLTMGWVRLSVGVLAIVAAYAPIFPPLAEEWASFSYLSHGFAIPLITSYFVWKRYREIRGIAPVPSWAGWPVAAGGLALYTIGTLGGEPFLARLSFVLTLLGTVLLLGGMSVAKEFFPGIAFLVFMIPLPYVTLKDLAVQARQFEAMVTATVLPWLGVPVFREGFLLHLPNITLEVAEECSGISAIAVLLALGAAYGYVHGRSRVVCMTLLLSAVPLGLTSNLVRIIATAAAAYYLGPVAINNFIHTSSGTTVFLMTLGALMLLDLKLSRLQLEG